MSRTQIAPALLMIAALLGGTLTQPVMTRAAQACFVETGFCIQGRFLDYWQINGGLARSGYPLSDEFREVLEDGKTYTVQYFERVRLEYHPEHAVPNDVQLGQFGRRILREAYQVDRGAYAGAIARTAPAYGATYFTETGHNVRGLFLDYWLQHGGLAQFGYPITDERYDLLEDNQLYRTQYFERARFEYHPQNEGTPYVVLLGRFGQRILAENAVLGGEFRQLFLTSPALQVQLGPPVSTALVSTGALQDFERGSMLYASMAPSQARLRGGFLDPDARPPANGAAAPRLAAAADSIVPTIYVLVGGERGVIVPASASSYSYFFTDTWTEGQPAGGGPGPQPGQYEPRRGFGKVWREHDLRQSLGYATSAAETGGRATVQYFAGGVLFRFETATTITTYAITIGYYCNGCGPAGIYQVVSSTPH